MAVKWKLMNPDHMITWKLLLVEYLARRFVAFEFSLSKMMKTVLKQAVFNNDVSSFFISSKRFALV